MRAISSDAYVENNYKNKTDFGNKMKLPAIRGTSS
jgi:hypothetical protein